MAINKVVLGDQTLIDLTNDTVTASSLLEGKTAHDKSGELITGTMSSSGSVEIPEVTDWNQFCYKYSNHYPIDSWIMKNNPSNYYLKPVITKSTKGFYQSVDSDVPLPTIVSIYHPSNSGTDFLLENFFMNANQETLPYLTSPYSYESGKYLNITQFAYGSRIKTLPNNGYNYFHAPYGEINYWADSYYGYGGSWFTNCMYLRNTPSTWLWPGATPPTVYDNFFYYLCANCYVLDAINNLPVSGGYNILSTNNFQKSFQNCYRLKSLTFLPDKTAQWNKQTIDLSSYIGYANDSTHITPYGLSENKQVTDDVTYQALKNDPDWWTKNVAYSRYNHDSAVETINSLPDTSGASTTVTNVIKFKGEAGSATDGGAINTLTDAEIAVAAAKGWTVTLV